MAALVEHIAQLSTNAPVLLVLEDAHWIDPTSLELAELLIERIRDLPVLVIITYRPEFTAPWIGGDHVTLLALNRLSRRERTHLAEQLGGDGVPLFVEELARSATEAGSEVPERTNRTRQD